MLTIRCATADDKDIWEALYKDYTDFEEENRDPKIVETVWGWLCDEGHELECFLVEKEGVAVAFFHVRRIPSTFRGKHIGLLDDLYVSPGARGQKIGARIIEKLKELAKERGWPTMIWIVQEDNYKARILYDKFAAKTDWNIYEMPC